MEDKSYFFEQNLLALSASDPLLCSRLSAAETTRNCYKFLTSQSGRIVPAITGPDGAAHPLHSLVDPEREGRRLAGAAGEDGFLVFLGLGGGYAVEAALAGEHTALVLAVEYNINGVAELLCSREYIGILGDPRFRLLVDPSPELLEAYILENYLPALSGGIRTFPLRSRVEEDRARFGGAGEAIARAIEKLSADYSVQTWFGRRWFSNIIRNLRAAEGDYGPVSAIREAAVCAAGPSLDGAIPLIRERREQDAGKGIYLIAADTSLSALLAGGVKPDAVVSIDCQHISSRHFTKDLPPGTELFLDLASPPLVASRSARPRFFSGGHPLAGYVSRVWRSFPSVDSSGGNVAYAALSLAEYLGASRIQVYGADFSYPRGLMYARGTYLYPYFGERQNRLSPLEGLFSGFLYRNPSLAKVRRENGDWYYETDTLSFYRKRFEEKAARLSSGKDRPAAGGSAVISVTGPRERRIFSAGVPRTSAAEFLERYRADIRDLGRGNRRIPAGLSPGERLILATLLPGAAAFKGRNSRIRTAELLEEVTAWCEGEIDRVLAAWDFPCLGAV
ncbi:MAG: DUF115 domain-containing protein [Treponema sp.]|jgi:hypothetical protein|nr:DUF115 domain-containing protein [Treponema sp.]